MAEKRDIISKGIYKHPQIVGFVSVKQYIFMDKNGKRGLVLRFSNDLDATENGMEFTVIELDSNGNAIRNSLVHYTGRVHSGCMFTSESAVIVEPKCCDFKVFINKVFADNYEYTAVGDKVLTRYTNRAETSNSRTFTYTEYEKISQKKPIREGVFRLIAVVLLLVMIVANFIFVFFDDNSDEQAETDEAKAELEEQTLIEQTFDFTRSGYVEIR